MFFLQGIAPGCDLTKDKNSLPTWANFKGNIFINKQADRYWNRPINKVLTCQWPHPIWGILTSDQCKSYMFPWHKKSVYDMHRIIGVQTPSLLCTIKSQLEKLQEIQRVNLDIPLHCRMWFFLFPTPTKPPCQCSRGFMQCLITKTKDTRKWTFLPVKRSWFRSHFP